MFQNKLNFSCHCCQNFWYFQTSKPWKYQFSLLKINVFSGFREKHVCAVFVHFSFQKSSQNPSKTRPEPFKNRCRKRVDFQHRFFEVLASIWEGLGPPRWSQVGHFGLKTLGTVLPKSVLKLDVFYKLRLGGLQAPFWRLQGSILEGLEMIFWYFCKLFGMLPRRRPSSTASRNPSDDLSHVGRADAVKKKLPPAGLKTWDMPEVSACAKGVVE